MMAKPLASSSRAGDKESRRPALIRIKQSAGQGVGAVALFLASRRGLIDTLAARKPISTLPCRAVGTTSPKQLAGVWTRYIEAKQLGIPISIPTDQPSLLCKIGLSFMGISPFVGSVGIEELHTHASAALTTLSMGVTVAPAINFSDMLVVKLDEEIETSSASLHVVSSTVVSVCGLGYQFMMALFQTHLQTEAMGSKESSVDFLSVEPEKDVASPATKLGLPTKSTPPKSTISTLHDGKSQGSPPCQPRHASPSLGKTDTTPSAPSSPKVFSKWALPCKPRSLAKLESTSSSWALPGRALSEPFLGEKNASRFSTPALGMARQVPASPGRSIKIAINLKAGGNGDGDEDQSESDYGNDKTTNIRSVSTATTVRDNPVSAAVRSTKVTIAPTRSVLKSSENYKKRDRAAGSCVRVHWRDILVEEDAQVAKERQHRAARWLRLKRQGPSTATLVSSRAIKISGVDDKVEEGSGCG